MERSRLRFKSCDCSLFPIECTGLPIARENLVIARMPGSSPRDGSEEKRDRLAQGIERLLRGQSSSVGTSMTGSAGVPVGDNLGMP